MTVIANRLYMELKGKGGIKEGFWVWSLGSQVGEELLHRQDEWRSIGKVWETSICDISKRNNWIAASRFILMGSGRRVGLELHTWESSALCNI